MLSEKQCIPCRGDVPPLTEEQRSELLMQIPEWTIVNQHHLSRTFKFDDFLAGLELVNKVALVAEEERHHPDIYLAWGKVKIDIWTHKIDNLTESDFILAAKIDKVSIN